MPLKSPRQRRVDSHVNGSCPGDTWSLAAVPVALLCAVALGCGVAADGQTSHVTDTAVTRPVAADSRATRVPAVAAPTGDTTSRGNQVSRGPTSGPATEAALSEPSQQPDLPSTAGRAPSGKVNEITFDDLKLDMPLGTLFEPSMLPPRVAELDGQWVRLRGFIYAGGVFQQTGIASFPFVMNTQCKFGPQGLAYCVILVDLDEGVTIDFTTYPIEVEGRLSVRPYNAGGFTWSVYHMQGRKVR